MRGKKVLRWIGIIFSILLPLLSISIPLNNYAAEVKEKENRIISARLKGTVSVNGTEMSPLILKDSKEGLENLRVLLEKKEIHAVMYLADTLQVISFDVEGEKVSGILRSGDEFLLQGVQMADDKSLWFHIKTVKSFNVIEGLIPAQYAACVDPDFLSWKNRYIESELASTDREENLFSIQSAEKINFSFLIPHS